MVPEWMVGVPDDLATQWFVIPRPQGKRCLVVANAGAATCRMRNGSRVEPRFQSHIPGGGRTAADRAEGLPGDGVRGEGGRADLHGPPGGGVLAGGGTLS